MNGIEVTCFEAEKALLHNWVSSSSRYPRSLILNLTHTNPNSNTNTKLTQNTKHKHSQKHKHKTQNTSTHPTWISNCVSCNDSLFNRFTREGLCDRFVDFVQLIREQLSVFPFWWLFQPVSKNKNENNHTHKHNHNITISQSQKLTKQITKQKNLFTYVPKTRIFNQLNTPLSWSLIPQLRAVYPPKLRRIPSWSLLF